MTGKWDGLAEDLSEPSRSSCGVAKFLETEDFEDDYRGEMRSFIGSIIEDKNRSAAVVAKGLAKRSEIAPSAWMIRVHRRGECACRRK